jgi:uncharacterized damage-inducible protein DinB
MKNTTSTIRYLGKFEAKLDWIPEKTFTYGSIVRHLSAHEIHHVGQLSVGSREQG